MPAISRILEILLYSVTLLVPWLAVTYYPFRTRLRFSANLAALFAAVMAVGRIAVDMVTGLGLTENAMGLQLILAAAYALCFFAAVRAPLVEMVVNLALVFVLAFASTTAVKSLETVLTPRLAQVTYSWSYTLILLSVEGIITIVYCLLYDSVRAKIAGLCVNGISGKTKDAPATEEKPQPAPEGKKEAPVPAAKEENTAPAAEAVEAEPVKEASAKAESVQVQPELTAAPPQEPEVPATASLSDEQLLSMQFTSLNSRILESRQVRKDLRRQIDTMTDCLNTKNYDRLRALLMAMRQQFATTSYGSDAALSAPLDYFAQLARSRGIQMNIDVQLPGGIPESIYPTDLIVVIGNLLDNALDACKAQKNPSRRISISIARKDQTLCFVVENTCELPVRQDEHGTYLSSKYDGPGAGLQVVRNITQRYNGELSIAHTNTSFQVSATLNA